MLLRNKGALCTNVTTLV